MTSERKATSNRKNAQNSTGPRSEFGRRHCSRNALRHGLAIAIGSDPSFSKDVEALATTLERGGGGQTAGEARGYWQWWFPASDMVKKVMVAGAKITAPGPAGMPVRFGS